MKIRTDFVSNSSSSSFICTAEDLDKNNVDWRGDKETLTLKDFCLRYCWGEIVGRYIWDEKEVLAINMRFVDDDVLADNFARGIKNMLPQSAKADWNEYLDVIQHQDELRAKDIDIWVKKQEIIAKMAVKLHNALASAWGNTVFVCIEAGDDNGDEQHMEREFSHGSWTFRRIHNNH